MAKQTLKRRPGRPPLPRDEYGNPVRTAVAPKRRGRPPQRTQRAQRGRLSEREVAQIAGDEAPKRRGRPPRQAAQAQQPKDDKPRKAYPLIGRNDLNRLLEQCLIYQNRASTAAGNIGELVREAVEKRHLHAGAFGMIKRLHNLGNKDRGKLWVLLAHFDDMRAKSGLDRLAQDQGQLLPAIADEEQHVAPEEGSEDEADSGEHGSEEKDESVATYPHSQPREVQEHAGDAA